MAEINNNQTKKRKNFLGWILWWRLDEDEVKRQVDEYHKLKITQSARGISFLLFIFSAIVTALTVWAGGWDSFSFVDVGIFLILGFLIYKGIRWATIVAMLLWTFEKGYSLFSSASGSGVLWAILFWVVYMHYLFLTYKVESARKHISKITEELSETSFCAKCGSKLETNSKYCIKCGSKVEHAS